MTGLRDHPTGAERETRESAAVHTDPEGRGVPLPIGSRKDRRPSRSSTVPSTVPTSNSRRNRRA